MKHEDLLLIENVLYTAISTFHDCSDKEQRNKLIKDYTIDFCKENNLDPIEVITKLKEVFENQRKSDPNKFPHFKGNALNEIIEEK